MSLMQERDEMMRFMRRTLALLIACLFILTVPAGAEVPFLRHSDGWDLEATPLDVSLTAEVTAHMPYDEDRLAMLTPIFEMAAMRILTEQDGGSVTISLAKEDVLTLAYRGNAVQLSCVPDVTYTAAADPVSLLLGGEASGELDFFGLSADAETLLDDGEALLAGIPEVLGEYGRKTTGKQNISGMGTAAYRYDYTVPAEDASIMQERLLSICPAGWLYDIIAGLEFSGKQTLRVYYSKADVLLRMEYNGDCGYGDDLRDTNLVWRMRRDETRKDEITLRTPAKKGKDKNNLTFTRVIETTKKGAIHLKGEFAYTITRDGESDVRKGDFDLTNAFTQSADVLTGSINLRHLPAGNSKYDQYEFEPDLTISGTQESPVITGTLLVREKWGQGDREEARLHIDLKRNDTSLWQERSQVIDLSALDAETLFLVQSQAAANVSTAIVRPLILLLREDAAWFFQDMSPEQIQSIIDAAKSAE